MAEAAQRSASGEETVASSDSSAGVHSGSDSVKEATVDIAAESGRLRLYERLRRKQVLRVSLLAVGILAVTFMVVKFSSSGGSSLSGMNTDSDTEQTWGEARAATSDDETPHYPYYMVITSLKQTTTRGERTTSRETTLPQPSPKPEAPPDASEKKKGKSPAGRATTSRARLGGEVHSGTDPESNHDEPVDDESSNGKSADDESSNGKSADDESSDSESADDESAGGVHAQIGMRTPDAPHLALSNDASALCRKVQPSASHADESTGEGDGTITETEPSPPPDSEQQPTSRSGHEGEPEEEDTTGLTTASSPHRDARALGATDERASETVRVASTGESTDEKDGATAKTATPQPDSEQQPASGSRHEGEPEEKDTTGVTTASSPQRDARALGASGDSAPEAVRVASTGEMPPDLKTQATADAGSTTQRR
ncbi:uncharacterized protein LOC144107381 [Amblyomma americanum]